MRADHTKVSSLRAFFEQQNNATPTTPSGDKNGSSSNPVGNGVIPKARVRSNFIPVGQTSSLTMPKIEPVIKNGPAEVASTEEKPQEKLLNVEPLKKPEDVPVVVKDLKKASPAVDSVVESTRKMGPK